MSAHPQHDNQTSLVMGTDSATEEKTGSRVPQFSAGVAANIATLVAGCALGWTSPSLPKLEREDTPIKISKEENSWISSLLPLGAIFGPFIAGYLVKKVGKKKALLISSVPALVSWISLAVGTSVDVVYAGRFIAGLTVGWIFTVVPIYCGEIAQDNVRGAIGSLVQIFVVIGILFEYVVGPYVSYSVLSIADGAFPILFLLAFVWMPESPYDLLEWNRLEDANKSIVWLRGKPQSEVAQEMKNMQANVENSKANSGTIKDLFATKGTTKAFIISLGLLALQQFSGINVVLFNAETIFADAGGSMQPEISTIISGVVMLASSVSTPFIVDRLGSRLILLMSAAGMSICLGVLGLCFYLKKAGVETSGFSFLPVAALLSYIIVYSFGFGPLPWTVMGEMFPSNIKPLASTLAASSCWFWCFIMTRFFNDLIDLIGDDFTYWLFALFCFGGVFFIILLVPNTKGKSFAEIQDILNS